jgi:hypothetical protein
MLSIISIMLLITAVGPLPHPLDSDFGVTLKFGVFMERFHEEGIKFQVLKTFREGNEEVWELRLTTCEETDTKPPYFRFRILSNVFSRPILFIEMMHIPPCRVST